MSDAAAATAADPGDIHAGEISFVADFESELPDGEYEVLVGHRVASRPLPVPPGAPPPAVDPPAFDEAYVSRQRIRVEGPRFALPADMVSARFPPVEGTGEYEAVLPHVVLRRKTLPWERTAAAADANEGTPWLALLLFHADDVPAGMALPWLARAAPVSELMAVPRGVTSYPDLSLEADEIAQDRCQLIDIPAALWARVAPRLEDLRWLAHGRIVTGPAAGSCSVVVANRLPQANQRCTAHLVSLEGLHRILPGGPELPTAGVVRLITLASWSFTSLDPERTFTRCVAKLDVGPLRVPGPPISRDAAEARAAQAFALGYTAKNHRTRAADRTLSWYRGPFLPGRLVDKSSGPMAVLRLGEPVHTADELVRYDPTTGLLDTSYAAAWQIGRLLMLQNTSVATALANWKHGNLLRAAVAHERDGLQRALLPLDLPDITRSPAGHVDAIQRGGARLLGGLDVHQTPAPATAAPPAASVAFQQRADLKDLPAQLIKPAMWSHTGCAQPLPATVASWLDRVRLLHGVPASYLIGEMRSLPPESLRLFELDGNWVRALVEGAFSVGRTSRAVAAHDRIHHDAVHTAGSAARGAASLAHEPATVSGCLLRSGVVFDWPLLEVRGYGGDGKGLPLLRPPERLTPALMLCLFQGRLAQIEVREPAVGLHFGFERVGPDGGPHRFQKPLRPLDGRADVAPMAVPFRNEADRVVDVQQLAGMIKDAVKPAATAADPGAAAAAESAADSAADFALEMVEGVQSVRFAGKAT